MLSLSSAARIFLYKTSVDMRKSFEGLSYLVEQEFDTPLTAGDYFVFLNRRKNMMKVLVWDIDGLIIWYKRLEKGNFIRPKIEHHLISRREFYMLLEGVIPKRLQKRFIV